VNDLTVFVLAGGKSRRMGTDKAYLRLGNEVLLDRAIKLAGSVADEVRIVGDAEKFASCTRLVTEDIYRERGPLGGIHAALSGTVSELNLMLAVDMPFLEPRFLTYLIAQARESGAIVTVPNAGGGFQPLCAVYRREFAEVAEDSLRAGRNKIDALFSKVSTRIIGEEELARTGFSLEMFRNLNTPEDLKRARGEPASDASRL
jgi:molybdopterin-guanine dinucleotide biosynthesis protein A